MRRVSALFLLGVLFALPGCSTNPATGEDSFTLFMSPEQERSVGAEQHPKVLAQYGGAYDDAEIGAYVAGIGGRLAAVSELPELRFTFTVLDSPVVNAFALPGGYVYVSRGLLALADDEAELAGVLAHEIGHVTARHSAERYSQTVLANLGAGLIGVLLNSGSAAQIAGLGADVALKSYSRGQELEADSLGIRYVARAGYDPAAVARFLGKLGAQEELAAALKGNQPENRTPEFLATHPRTPERMERASATAAATPVATAELRRASEEYVRRLDGLVYGDDPKEGLVKGTAFIHPALRFRFEVPEGFRLVNGRRQVAAHGPNGALVVFDHAPRGVPGPLTDYLARDWGRNLRLANLEAIEVNGMTAATGGARVDTDRGPHDLRLVAIRYEGERVYRFLMLTPTRETAELETALKRTTYSFRKLSAREAAAIKPQRLRTVTVRPGDTVAKLARRMPDGALPEQRFRVLNGLAPGEEPKPGRLVKIVAE